jgi:hypothetical protein
MTPETFVEPDDDPAFLGCVDRIIAGLIERYAVEDVYVMRIANWFDHKWLAFSFRQERFTVPPFTPNRVVTQHYFGRTSRGDFEEQSPSWLVHRPERERSSKNLRRRLADLSESAVFVWFSSHSAANGRGSIMTCIVCPETAGAWYAGFRYAEGWRLDRVEGTSRTDVESILEGRPLAAGA